VSGDLLTAVGTAPLVSQPQHGRTFASERTVRLSDMDDRARVRLDAVARYLQDVAIEDVEETGWGLPEHLWFIRRIRIDVMTPLLHDRLVRLVTWCSGVSGVAAGRRWSLTGDAGGHVEVDSVWIHLGPGGRPERLDASFGVYAEAAEGRPVTTRLELSGPPADATRTPWPLRLADVDVHGHVNNATYWQAVEQRLALAGPDPSQPLRARLEYRDPIDLGDEVELLELARGGRLDIAFSVEGAVKAVAAVEVLEDGEAEPLSSAARGG
jgi:acyl-ACP thioesterase